jgi:hypothetical protein
MRERIVEEIAQRLAFRDGRDDINFVPEPERTGYMRFAESLIRVIEMSLSPTEPEQDRD